MDAKKNHAQWCKDYEQARQNPPSEKGTIIQTMDGSPCVVHIELPEGKQPFYYAILYLTSICSAPVGWYARSVTDKSNQRLEGIKCIFMSQSRNKLLREKGIAKLEIAVDRFQIHHVSESGKSILVELVPDVDD